LARALALAIVLQLALQLALAIVLQLALQWIQVYT
jgi:hypothetical protein